MLQIGTFCMFVSEKKQSNVLAKIIRTIFDSFEVIILAQTNLPYKNYSPLKMSNPKIIWIRFHPKHICEYFHSISSMMMVIAFHFLQKHQVVVTYFESGSNN